MTRYVVIEGADGTGTTTHADLLAAALRAEGVDARAFHHARPALGDPWRDALAYASQRAALVSAPPAEVVVCDRWHWSTMVEGAARNSPCFDALHRGEWLYVPVAAVVYVLDAPDDVLDARLIARGETVTHHDHIRRVTYRALAAGSWPVDGRMRRIDTARPVAEVTREILALAKAALR